MKKRNLLYILLPLTLMFSSCEPEFKDEIVFEPGEADFRNYVAVGNSLAAGYQSNALSREGQLNSYPAILARQFAQVEEGMGIFKQALLPGHTGDVGAGVNATAFANNLVVPALKLDYKTDCRNDVSLSPVLNGPPYSYNDFLTNVGSEGPYNNYGIPGAKTFHLLANGYGNPANLASGNANPYYVRMVDPSNNNESVIEAALRTNPTFFTVWIGNNDVLSYALSGGEGDVITSPNDFANNLNLILKALTDNNAEGVIANIPDITSLPYFNTVPWNALTLTAGQAAMLNAHPKVVDYNNGLDQAAAATLISQEEADRRKLVFQAGANGFLTEDSELTDLTALQLPNYRLLESNELITLSIPQDSIKCAGFGSIDMRDPQNPQPNPITEQYVLTESEINEIHTHVDAYNNSIENHANIYSIALVDANALLKEFESGISYDGVNYSTTFVTGGLFSLDGFHPNSRGHAIIANAHIDAINATYSANVPKVNVNDYTGIVFP